MLLGDSNSVLNFQNSFPTSFLGVTALTEESGLYLLPSKVLLFRPS